MGVPIAQGEYSTVDEEYDCEGRVIDNRREDFDGDLKGVVFDGTWYAAFCDFYALRWWLLIFVVTVTSVVGSSSSY